MTTARKLAAEGEICWGGMHSWRTMVDLLERVGEPDTVGFQADMAHTLLYTLGENAPEDRILPESFDWQSTTVLDSALVTLTAALRPWTLDFHVAQNDATVHRLGLARPHRPPLPGDRPQRQARTSPTMPASGSATKAASSPRNSGTSAGTAACSPTTS